MATQDLLWKGIIEDLFEEMMAFFYPDHMTNLDFSEIAFLDQELQELSPDAEMGRRVADKLVRVNTKEGREKWILFHVEVQGYVDPGFAKRMFTYFYRIYDRYQVPIEAIAIFTDRHPDFRPQTFNYQSYETFLTFGYKTYKVLSQEPKLLAQLDNPFAMVVLVVREFLQHGKLDDSALFELKIHLFRKLLKKGWNKEQIHQLTVFIKHYVRFQSAAQARAFDIKVNHLLERETSMGIIETIQTEILQAAEAKGIEQGMEKGMEQGIEKGIEQGIEMGRYKAEMNMIFKLLEKGFSVAQIQEMLDFSHELIARVKLEWNKQTNGE